MIRFAAHRGVTGLLTALILAAGCPPPSSLCSAEPAPGGANRSAGARRPKDGPAGPFEQPVADRVMLDSVRRMNLARLRLAEQPRSRRLMEDYHRVVLRWARMLAPQAVPVADHPDWLRYEGSGARQGCYAALIFAFVAKADAPADLADEPFRVTARAQAIAGLRYLAQGHLAGGGVYLSDKTDTTSAGPWGGNWQSALYAHSLGLAGWLLWDDLDDATRLGVARVLEFEADRFLHLPPLGNLARDTKAEENAWNAMLISVAGSMLPRHPRAARWQHAAKSYLYNTFSTDADRTAGSPGDDGRPVREWVNTVNVHPDFTLENHGLAHIGYMKTSLAELLCCAVPYLLAEQPVPRAALHHAAEVFDVVASCLAWDGAAVCFGGNDWALFHQQAADAVAFSLLSLLAGDRRAAAVEDIAVDYLKRQQAAHGGFVDVRHDLTYTSQCCVRLINAWIGHALLGAGAPVPLSPAELDRAISGVRVFPHGKVILHRTPTKFASFAWGAQRLALALPREGNWVVWPHFSSHLGEINGTGASEQSQARLRQFRHRTFADGFAVAGALSRSGGVVQDFAFVSLPADITIYLERLKTPPGAALTTRETGIVGHAYELGRNERTLRGPFGVVNVIGFGGEERVRELRGDWLNLGDKVGYAILRQPGRENLIRYHDHARGKRWPQECQEWFSLIGDPAPLAFDRDDWAGVLTFLNQRSAATRQLARQVAWEATGDVARCQVGAVTIAVDFRTHEVAITPPRPPAAGPVPE